MSLPARSPLRDHALLADGRRGAVIDPDGDIVWLCFPRWHDPALFSTMLGGGGHYAVTPRRALHVGRALRARRPRSGAAAG